MHLREFRTLGMSYTRLEQPWPGLDKPRPGLPSRITFSGDSIGTMPFQAGTTNIKIAVWGQHSSNSRIPYLISFCCAFQGIGDQPNKNPGALFSCLVDIFSNGTNCEIQWPGMVIAWKIGQESLVRCTNEWANHHSSRILKLRILPPITRVNLAVYSAMFKLCKADQLKIEVRLTWEMCKMVLYTFENIQVVQWSEDMWIISN